MYLCTACVFVLFFLHVCSLASSCSAYSSACLCLAPRSTPPQQEVPPTALTLPPQQQEDRQTPSNPQETLLTPQQQQRHSVSTQGAQKMARLPACSSIQHTAAVVLLPRPIILQDVLEVGPITGRCLRVAGTSMPVL